MTEIDFRFPGGRWERCPSRDEATALLLYGANYDLRIDGKVRKATPADETTHCANCGGEVPVDKPHRVGECETP